MITLLGLGVPGVEVLRPPTGPVPGTAALRLLDLPAGEADVLRLVGVVAGLLDAGRPVLVLHCDEDTELVRPLVRLVRRSLGTARVASLPTSLPPLAAGVLAERMLGLAERELLDAGGAFAALPELESDLSVRAWLGSATRRPRPVASAALRRPSPSARQRLASLVPRGGWLATVQPGRGLTRAGADAGAGAAVAGDPTAVLLVAGDDPLPSWVEQHVLRGPGTAPVLRLPAARGAPGWWGSSRVVELVGVPVADRSPGPAAASSPLCGWCAVPVRTPGCPFCGLTDPARGRRPRGGVPAGRVAG